jgi:glycosyltransferase involved in cell wall biosynthesis
MNFRAAYISYADYGGPLIHTKEFVSAFRRFVPDLVTYCPYLDRDLSYVGPGRETFFNILFSRLPPWSRQLKLEFYQLRKFFRDWAKWPYFKRLYQDHNVDIIVVRNDAYVVGAIYAANKISVPYILETNGVLSKDSPDRISRSFEKYALTKAAGITAVSSPLAEIWISYGVPQNKIRIVTNGVSLEAFKSPDLSVVPKYIYGKLRDKITIGYVGTFTVNHDVHIVIDAFSKAISVVPNLRLLLLGDGPSLQEVKEKIKCLEIENSVILAGKIQYDHVPAYLSLCQIAASPMRQVYEEGFIGVPIKMFEYMASKLPIISTDMPNLRQLFNDSAIYASPESEVEWRDAIITLAQNEKLRQQKGIEAHEQLIKRGYTWEENARKVFEYCKEILSVPI